MIYPIKTLGQLPPILKGFRKAKGLTQAAMAERLGITQQSYAYFEANPASATLERLFLVLRMLDVEISLDHTPPTADTAAAAKATDNAPDKRAPAAKASAPKTGKTLGSAAKQQAAPSAPPKPDRTVASARKKESW